MRPNRVSLHRSAFAGTPKGPDVSEKHALMTGNGVSGLLTLADGSQVDVTPDWLFLDSLEEAAAIAAAIELAHNNPEKD